MYIVWTGQVHCSLQLFLAILMWYLVLVFRSYSCFVTIFWSICFSSSQVFASILRWVFHISFFFCLLSGVFVWLFSTTLYWYCSFLALQLFFGNLVCSYHCFVLDIMSFWKSLLFPKGPRFIHSKLFSSCFVSFKVPKCEQCLRYDCLFLSQASSITGLSCGYAAVLSFHAHTSWLHMPSRVRHTTLFSYLPGTYFWCNWLLICQIQVCHWGLCIECLWLSLTFVFFAIVYCNSHFAVSAML